MNTLRTRALAAAALLALILPALTVPVARAHAEAIVTSNIRDATAQLFVTDAFGGVLFNNLIGGTALATETFTGGASASTTPSFGGITGAFGSRQINSTYLPGDPGFGNAFTGFSAPDLAAFSRGTQTDAALKSEVNAFSRVILFFTLDAPTAWSWSATNVTGSSDGTGPGAEYFFGLFENAPGVVDYTFSQSLTGDFNQAVGASGILQAGDWELDLILSARTLFDLTTGASDHFVFLENGLFTLTAVVPEPAGLAVLGVGLLGLAGVRRRLVQHRS